MAKTAECVSCGADTSSPSEQGFCEDCQEHWDQGVEHQELVYTRAYLLEEAKHKQQAPRVKELMGDIFEESLVIPEPTQVVIPTAADLIRAQREASE